NMTKASIRLPRSRRCIGRSTSAIASVCASRERKKVTKANAESPQPTVKVMPYIVELHFGSVDIIQSIEAKVSTRTISTSPEAAHLRRDSSVYGDRLS